MRTHINPCFYLTLAGLALVIGACVDLSPLDGGSPIDAALGQIRGTTDVAGDIDAPSCADVGTPATLTHKAVFDALNYYRIENGLQPLVYSKALEAAGDAHVRDLYVRDFFDHVNPDGQGPPDRALEAGFCHQYVGENIAAGQRSVARVMEAWKESPPHDANMLEPDFVYVGIGHYTSPTGREYWAQEFAFDYP
jgi:uncharacterized protein YkwD